MNARGTVLRARLDPIEGREQAGTRPVLVVSATFFNERAELLIVSPITSKKVERIFPFEVRLDHEACGLEVPSKVMLNQIRAIDKKRIVGIHGFADEETMAAVTVAMQITLGMVDL